MKRKLKATNKTIKCKLRTILDPTLDNSFLYDIISRTNQIVFSGSHFIRLYILYLFKDNKQLPKIDKDFIMMCFKVLKKSSRGPKPKNVELHNNLSDFYNNHFIKIIYPNEKFNKDKIDDYKYDGKNLSYILGCSAEEMVVSYTNNIKLNFFKYVCQFVNQSFKKEHQKLIDDCKEGKTELRKSLKLELRKVKDDLILGTSNSDIKYKKWIDKVKNKILPTNPKNSKYVDDLKYYPERYLSHMLYMNKYLEDNELKTFQPISLRTDIKEKYITINTNALVDIIPTIQNKNEYNNNIRDRQDDIWEMVFNLNLNKSKFKIKNYSFNYQIHTDGYAVSISYIHNSEIETKNKKLDKKLGSSKKSKQINKNKSFEEITRNKKEKYNNLVNHKIKENLEFKEQQKRNREEIKKLSLEEQENIKIQKKLNNNEFNYIEDLIKFNNFRSLIKEAYDNNKIGYGDPGKRSPITILNNKNEKFEYRTSRRIRETKRQKYNKLIDNKKTKTKIGNDKQTIKEIELKLSELSGKTISYKSFIEFTKLKLKMRKNIIAEQNYNQYLQKLSWFAYINKRRHEDNLLNELEAFLGKNAVLIIGDWSNKGKLSYISTPCIGLQRKLLERFSVFHIDEYNTSKIHHRTEKKCENLCLEKTFINKKTGKEKTVVDKMHPILTYQMSNGRLGCINRDNNAIRGMKKITESLLETGKRPSVYKRRKLTNPQKNTCI